MKYLNFTPIDSVSAALTTTGQIIDLNQIIKVSVQVIAGAGTLGGSFKLEVSNDQPPNGYLLGNYQPTNWSALGSPTVLSSAGITLIPQQDMCYRFMRAVYTDTVAIVNTVVATADVGGDLNSTYFLINSPTVGYYAWVNVDSTGVDPAIAGRTGIPILISEDDTADDVGAAIRTAFGLVPAFTVTGATTTAILTNAVAGPAAVAVDGAVPTGFTITNNAPSSSITVNVMALSL